MNESTDDLNPTYTPTRTLPLPVYVKMVGENGNSFAILGRIKQAMTNQLRKRGWGHEDIEAVKTAYFNEATSGDYNHLLQTTIAWVHTDEEPPEEFPDDEGDQQ